MQSDLSKTLWEEFFNFLLNVKYLVFSVILGNYCIVKYTWNLLDAEEHIIKSGKGKKVKKSQRNLY